MCRSDQCPWPRINRYPLLTQTGHLYSMIPKQLCEALQSRKIAKKASQIADDNHIHPITPDILLQPYRCRMQVRIPRIATIQVSAGQLPTTIFQMLLDLSQLASEVFPIIGSAWYASSPRRCEENPTPSKASCVKACRDTAIVDAGPIE